MHIQSPVLTSSPANRTSPLGGISLILDSLSIAAESALCTASLVLLSFIFPAIESSCLSKFSTSAVGLPGGM